MVLFKNHHSLMDGVSSMGLTLQCDDEYCPDKLIKFSKVPLFKRMLVRLMAPLMIPVLMYDMMTTRTILNPLHDGIRQLTGIKKCSLSELYDFTTIKDTAHALGVTINDLMVSSLSVGVQRYFKEKDPKSN